MILYFFGIVVFLLGFFVSEISEFFFPLCPSFALQAKGRKGERGDSPTHGGRGGGGDIQDHVGYRSSFCDSAQRLPPTYKQPVVHWWATQFFPPGIACRWGWLIDVCHKRPQDHAGHRSSFWDFIYDSWVVQFKVLKSGIGVWPPRAFILIILFRPNPPSTPPSPTGNGGGVGIRMCPKFSGDPIYLFLYHPRAAQSSSTPMVLVFAFPHRCGGERWVHRFSTEGCESSRDARHRDARVTEGRKVRKRAGGRVRQQGGEVRANRTETGHHHFPPSHD